MGVKFPVPVSEATEKHIPVDTLTTSSSDDGDGIHDKAREILSSQGIDFSDLLKLQKKLIKSSSPKMGKDAVAARNRSSSKPSNKDKEPSPPLPLQLQQPITKTSLPLTSPPSSSSFSSSVVEDKEDVLVLLEGDLINGGRKKRKTSSLKEIPYPIMDSSVQVQSQPDRAKPRKVASKDTTTVTARAESPKSKKSPPSKEIADVNLTGVTLSNMMTELVSSVGYDALYEETNLRCFKVKPTLRSSLKVQHNIYSIVQCILIAILYIICICMYVCMYACAYVCVCMYVCMYRYIFYSLPPRP